MFWKRTLDRLKRSNFSIRTYITEISLIILSILIAIQADRCNQDRKSAAKLENYLQSMYRDLLDEQIGNRNNLEDCRKDLSSIQRSLQLCRHQQDDSLDLALQHLKSVFSRGVFRTFPPTTFDIMLSTGDISLIRDIEFRNRLAATFSFRDTYIQTDLQEFDRQIMETSRELGKYVDLACLTTADNPHRCLTDRTGFMENAHNELFILMRMAHLREFHLQVAVDNFARMIGEMEALIEPAEAEE